MTQLQRETTLWSTRILSYSIIAREKVTHLLIACGSNMCNALPLLVGLHFSVVDLRWGVRNTATDDHMTIDICLGEIERCMKTSTAASFVFLSGERYGWRALPNRVDNDEFKLVLSHVASAEDKRVIQGWYLQDENSQQPVFILQRISTMKARTDIPHHNDFWRQAQSIIQSAVRSAFAHADISDEVRRNWGISVTEREVLKGLLDRIGRPNSQVEVDSIVLMRTIKGLEEAARNGNDKANMYYTPRDDDRELLNALRDRVHTCVPSSAIKQYTVAWSPRGLSFDDHSAEVRSITAEFVSRVKNLIDLGLQKRKLLVDSEKEFLHHHSFALIRYEAFFGRTDVKSAMANLVMQEGPVVRCLYGASGSGKTSATGVVAYDLRYSHLPMGAVVLL